MSLFAPIPPDWHMPATFKRFNWIEPDVLGACIYPRTDLELAELAGLGVTLIVNMHERSHDALTLERHNIRQLHLAVPDMSPPAPPQIELGVSAIEDALADGGSIQMPLAQTFWSPCYGMVTDRFGVGWMVMVPGPTN